MTKKKKRLVTFDRVTFVCFHRVLGSYYKTVNLVVCPVNRNTPSVGETQKYPEPIQGHGVTVARRSPKPSVRVRIFVFLQIWRVRITVSTSDFHSGNRGSIPLPATRKTSGCGPVGRASGLGPEGRTFEPCHPDRVGTKPAQAFRNEAPDFTGSKLVGNRIPTGCQETYIKVGRESSSSW